MNENICRAKGTEKQATKNMQIVLQHCYDELNSDIAPFTTNKKQVVF